MNHNYSAYYTPYYYNPPPSTTQDQQWAHIPTDGHAQSRDYQPGNPTAPPPPTPPPPPPPSAYDNYSTVTFTDASAPSPSAPPAFENDPLALFFSDSPPQEEPEEERVPTEIVAVLENEPAYSDIPADLVASQQQILDEIKRRSAREEQSIQAFLSHERTQSTMITDPWDTTTETRIVSHNNNERALVSVPRSYNPSGSDAVHPRKYQMKQARPLKTAAGAMGGVVVGGLVMAPVFPLGMMIGGVAGGVATNKACKAGERRAQRKWEQRNYQSGIQDSQMMAHMQREGTGIV